MASPPAASSSDTRKHGRESRRQSLAVTESTLLASDKDRERDCLSALRHNIWFFSDDIKNFVRPWPSWMPHSVYLLYRIVVALYFLGVAIWTVYWYPRRVMVAFSSWTILTLVICTTIQAIVKGCCPIDAEVHERGNVAPLYLILLWVANNIDSPSALTTSIGYWTMQFSGRFISCPHEWYSVYSVSLPNSPCYAYFPSAQNWSYAQDQCTLQGAELASVHHSSEQQFLWHFFVNDFITDFEADLLQPTMDLTRVAWIGLHRDTSGANWTWSDGSEYDYKQWAKSFPSGDLCAATFKNWMDKPCDTQLPYICQKPVEQANFIAINHRIVMMAYTIIDMFLNAIPYRLLHFWQPLLFGLAHFIFWHLYWHESWRFWESDNSDLGYYYMYFLIPSHIFLWLLYKFKVLCTRICCSSKDKHHSHTKVKSLS